MIHVEVRGGEGGEDAALFAEQLTGSIFSFLSNDGFKPEFSGATSLVVEAPKECV